MWHSCRYLKARPGLLGGAGGHISPVGLTKTIHNERVPVTRRVLAPRGSGPRETRRYSLPVSMRTLRLMLALPVMMLVANCSRTCRWAVPDGDFRLAYSAYTRIR